MAEESLSCAAAQASTRLVILAHPDDAEFTVAGTVARWVKEGSRVVYVVCTDGSRGSNAPDMTPALMKPIRHSEQQAAAAVLGVSEVIFLDREDGTLTASLELRRDLSRMIRRFRPDIVICSDHSSILRGNSYVNHPDHRAAGEAALYAIFPSACTRFIFRELLEEGLEPHKVQEIYLYGSPESDTWVDISDTMRLKLEALKCHRSQVKPEYVDARLSAWNGELGRRYGVAYAEEFKRIVLT
jgi:LmbE family N-acetylglucosaminyl deacetylase